MSARTALIVALSLLCAGCGYRLPGEPAARPFDFDTDRFAFANETVWNYVDGTVQPEDRPDERRYTRRCFVLCRSALEFWKFARFEPDQPPLQEEELARRIREVTGRGAWLDPLPRERRVVFPGYASLMELSAAHGDIFRENLGSGWASYFRPGNVLIAFPPGAGHQERLDEMLRASLALNHPVVLWLINFPAIDINHAVLVYSVQRRGDRSVYGVYDPNDAKASRELTYDSSERAFSFEATFYFLGGELDARAIYQDFLR